MKTKLYLKDQKVYDLLWNRLILEYSNNTTTSNFEGFSNNLIKTLIYLKKDNEVNLKKLYEKLFNKKSNDIEYIYEEIVNLIENLKKERNKEWLYKIYDSILNLWIWKKNIDEVAVSDLLFSLLTDFSKKKALLYNLKKKYPKKENETLKDYKHRLKNIVYDLKELYNQDDDMISDMYSLWLDELFYQLAINFSNSPQDAIFNLLNNWEVDDDNIWKIIKFLEESWVSEKQISKLKEEFFIVNDLKPSFTEQLDKKIKWEKQEKLQEIEKTPRKTIADFNPFLIPLDFGTWIKTLWYERFVEIYNKIFYWISKEILDKLWWINPSFNKFLKFDIDKLQNKTESKEKKYTYQYIIEYDVKDFDTKKLKELAILLNEEIWDINLASPVLNKDFKHPLTTLKWDTKYDAYFSDSGEWFIDNNIILLKWEDGTNKVRLTLSTFSQDEYIYLLSQIWYFIKYNKFIDKNQLYFDIYDKYNQTLFKEDLFDIKVLEKNYEQFVRNIILPLSKRWLKLWLKPSNILLAWPYGTSKSQFLKHILLNKKWEFKNQTFLLNATIIPIWLQEFKALLLQWLWWIKTRLDEIYQRTSTPIVLLVEDLDTLINKKAFWVNDELAQAMTLFFEWLGSLPVNVITTSNDPTKFSERLIRPNRISKILIFNRPTIEEKKKMLDEHLNKSKLKLEKDILNIIYNSNVFKKWTAAHISEIVKEISNYILSEKALLGNNIKLDNKIVENILSNIPVSSKDLDEREKIIINWHSEISWKKEQWRMWFIN